METQPTTPSPQTQGSPVSFNDHFDVLDHGYVRLITWMPWNMAAMTKWAMSEDGDSFSANQLITPDNDLAVVNAAKASNRRESDEIGNSEDRLMSYLGSHNHTSPYRHGTITFEVKAPLMVARQWFKYRVGSVHSEYWHWDGQGDDGSDDPLYARNEASRRYVTEEPEFYSPAQWREAPAHKKQGSGEWAGQVLQQANERKLTARHSQALDDYRLAIDQGIAPEQARLYLPAYGLYIYWRWTASIQGVAHFLTQRLEDDAQREIQEYAQVIYRLAKQDQVYPLAFEKLVTDPIYKTEDRK